MKQSRDAFGHALYDFQHEIGSTFHVIERDDGYVDVATTEQYFTSFDTWHSSGQTAIELVQGRTLDIGCGAGRHALHLQQQGIDVLGIDVSPLAIEVCKLRGLRQAQLLSATQLSRKHGIFDTILLMGNNFGLFANPRRAQWLLRRFKGMTSPQARIITQCLNPYGTDKLVHLNYHARNRQRGHMSGQVRIRARYQQYIGAWFDYLFVSPDEMCDILRGTGWHITRIIGGQPYVAILEKS